MKIYETFMLLYKNIWYIDIFLLRCKETYIKTTNKLSIDYIRELRIKDDPKNMKFIKYQTILLLYIIATLCPVLGAMTTQFL